jgi:7,8-dihydropterin-6-yl-methyl-4-(beta-D-ribofuranosyl)aminobenzene 5'-phosphate synthase
MKLTVLVDNNTCIDRYFMAEPGLSLLIETRTTRVLFDTGYSDLFLTNSAKMGLDLGALDFLVLSHSHLDHTWGLAGYLRFLTERAFLNQPVSPPTLVAHPDVFVSQGHGQIHETGALISREKAARHLALNLSRSPVQLSPDLIFLGQIPRENDFERPDLLDPVPDDSALVFHSSRGLLIITGCAQAGICNTIEYARCVCQEDKIADVIGGFHLLSPTRKRIEATCGYFKTLGLKALHPCHCTDLESRIALARVAGVKEVGVGLTLDYGERP